VFARSGGVWAQTAYLKASNTDTGDNFGTGLALSGDGTTLAVGAPLEWGSATGVNGNPFDNTVMESGAVYVFARTGNAWSQQAYVKASNTGVGDEFGYAVALSDDGTTLAVGAREESSNATGIGGNQADNSALATGAVYVFTRAGVSWGQQAYIKASNSGKFDSFGSSVALSSDGATLAVGAPFEASRSTGIDGDQLNNDNASAGAVYVFSRGTAWAQSAYIKASNTDAQDKFGTALALNGDGTLLVVGAPGEESSATGINGNQLNNTVLNAGAAYRFVRSATGWTQVEYIKSSNVMVDIEFGSWIALSRDAATLAIGGPRESSNARGIDGNQAGQFAAASGAVYVFR